MTVREQGQADLEARIDALQATVAALEKQVGRAGREQLKANALAETQTERLAAALEALQAAEASRAAEVAAARAIAAEARLEVARAMFPAIDGLDEAIRAGHATLEHYSRPEAPDALLRRLLDDEPAPASPDALLQTLRAWLEGLTMVRRRLLDALAAEGITAMDAKGRPFDPRRHIAVEAIAAPAPPGSVLQEIRRGFATGERVLRHAEVAVARAPQIKDEHP